MRPGLTIAIAALGVAVGSNQGCSLLFSSGGDGATDAGDVVDADVVDAKVSDADARNLTDPTQPYDCDQKTLALYPFEGETPEVGIEQCRNELAFELLGPVGVASSKSGFGQAAIFDGGKELKSREPLKLLSSASPYLKIELWVRVDALPASDERAILVGASDGSINQFELSVEDDETIVFRFFAENCSDTEAARVSSGIALSSWQHVSAVLATDSLTLTIGGVSSTAPISDPCLDSNGTPFLRVGETSTVSEAVFRAAIDELRISSAPRE